MEIYLLPLTGVELETVLDALNVLDPEDCRVLGQDPQAIAERCRGLRDLSDSCAEQWLKGAGLGRYKGKPQG